MMNLVFMFILLMLAKVCFSQTLTPQICWSFDGRNTDEKEIDLVGIEIIDFSKMTYPLPVKIAESNIIQPIAFIDKNNQRWIIMPIRKPYDGSISYEQYEKREAIKNAYYIFLLSVHDLAMNESFKHPKEVLTVEKNMPILMYKLKKRAPTLRSLESIFSAYQSISDSTILPYPSKAERLGTFMLSFLAYNDSLQQIEEARADEIRKADSIAIAKSMPAQVQQILIERGTKYDIIADSLAAAATREAMIADSMATVMQMKMVEDSIAAVYATIATATMMADSIMMAQMSLPKTKIKCNATTHDFGKVTLGKKVYYTFIIKNIGKEDLYIYDINTDYIMTEYCVNTPIKPGNDCRFTVFWTPTKYDIGFISKNFNIKGNFEGEKTLTYKANVIKD